MLSKCECQNCGLWSVAVVATGDGVDLDQLAGTLVPLPALKNEREQKRG